MKTGVIFISFLLLFLNAAFGQIGKQQNLDLYILIGQSNMSGRGKIDGRFVDEGSNNVLMFNRTNEWVTARHPIHFDKPKSVGVGPGLAFGIMMAKANKSTKVGLIPCAVGGTSIERWRPGAIDPKTKTHPYDDAVARIKLAMPYGVVKGVIWHQGESNSNPKNSKEYLAQLKVLVQRIRDLVGNPKLPFIVGELGRYRSAYVDFNSKLDSVSLMIPFTAVVSSRDLVHKGDSTHFDGASATKLGKRYAVAMRQTQRKIRKTS